MPDGWWSNDPIAGGAAQSAPTMAPTQAPAGNQWWDKDPVTAAPATNNYSAAPTADIAPVPSPAPKRSLGGQILHGAEVAGVGVGKGAAAMTPAGLLVNLPAYGVQAGAAIGVPIAAGINYAMGSNDPWTSAVNTARDVQQTAGQYMPTTNSMIDKALPDLPKPENKPEEFINTAAQFAGGSRAAGMSVPLSVGAGITSEAAGQATSGSPFEPLARIAGGAAPVAIARAMPENITTENPMKPQEPLKASMGQVGRAVETVQNASQYPGPLAGNVAKNMGQNGGEIVEGVKPTLGEVAGDQGIAQRQNALQQKYPQPFQGLEQQRNLGMAKSLQKPTELGNPSDIGDFVGARIGDADQAAADQISSVGQYGRQPQENPTGDTIMDARGARKEAETKDWEFLDKIKDQPADLVTLRNTAQGLVDEGNVYGAGGLHPAVKGVVDQILKPPQDAADNINTLKMFRSQLSDAKSTPQLPATAMSQLGRLTQAVDKGIENTVKGQALQEPGFYDKNQQMFHGGRGINPNGLTYFTKNKDMAQSYVDMTNERYGAGSGSLSQHNVSIQKPAPWSVVAREAIKQGINPNDTTPASVFDREIYGDVPDKIAAALKAKGYDGAILDDVAYGKQIQDKAHIPFSNKQINSEAAPTAVKSGDVDQYAKARQTTMRNYTLKDLEQRGAINQEGRIASKKMDTFQANPKNRQRLQADQEFNTGLQGAVEAQKGVDALKENPLSATADSNNDPVKIVGKILSSKTLDAAKQSRAAMDYVGDNPDAVNGLKSAYAQWINDNVAKASVSHDINNQELGRVGQPDKLRQFFNTQRKALSEVFEPQELQHIENVAREIQRNQEYQRMANIKGQSNTNKNQLQNVQPKPSMYGWTLDKLNKGAIAAAAAGEHFGGIKGAAIGYGGAKVAGWLQKLRDKGIENENMLELKMYTDPSFYQTMKQRIDSNGPSDMALNRVMNAMSIKNSNAPNPATNIQSQSGAVMDEENARRHPIQINKFKGYDADPAHQPEAMK